MSKIIKNLGTDDSVNVCDCCGRDNLKATVAFETESGDVVYYGVVCAARAIGSDAKTIRAEARKADDARATAARIAAYEAEEARRDRWVAHLVSITGGIKDYSGRFCVPSMLRACGGFAKASACFAG